MQVVGGIAMTVLTMLVVAELVWSRLCRRRVYDLRDSLGNVAILIGSALIKPV